MSRSERRTKNEGPGNILVLAQAIGAGGRGRFKDNPVRAGLTERAPPRLTALGNAHQPPESHSECASQRVALADGGELQLLLGNDPKSQRKKRETGRGLAEIHDRASWRARIERRRLSHKMMYEWTGVLRNP